MFKSLLNFSSVKRSRHGVENVPRQYNSYATISGVQSAIKYEYTERGMALGSEIETLIAEFSAGYKRKVAQLRSSGELRIMEGKAPMSVAGYRFLAQQALQATKDFNLSLTCHAFLLLCWNLMARSITTANLRLEHVTWRGDALVIEYGLAKNDQTGEMSYPRHVYANPSCPEICPILSSLAILMFTQPPRNVGLSTLLFGPKERFSTWLAATCHTCQEEILALGLSISEIGSHSFRKGVATELANCPGGPHAVSIWLRAGWSLGNVQSRYIFQGAGGDQFAGRAASGLSVNDVSFASLPPHFHGVVLSPIQWDSILPGYSSFYPATFRCAVPYLLASLVHHYAWLKLNLNPNHPLLLSHAWTSGILPQLFPQVLTGVLENTTSRMVATGIPPHVPLSIQLQSVKSAVENIGTSIQKKLELIPDQISTAIQNQCRSSRVEPVTMEVLNNSLQEFGDNIIKRIESITTLRSPNMHENTPNLPSATPSPLNYWWVNQRQFATSKLHCPKGKLYDLWNL
ncbi:hypothetical protein AaE_012159, partial [Aphanomyces astaci]